MKVEGKEKLLVPRLDNLLKHVGRHKAKVLNRGVEASFFNFDPKNQHVQNEKKLHYCRLSFNSRCCCCRSSPCQEKKIVQFVAMFHLLSKGQVMMDFEGSIHYASGQTHT